MPVVVVATMTVKPESVDTVRDILTPRPRRSTRSPAASCTRCTNGRDVRLRRAVGRRRRAEGAQQRPRGRQDVHRVGEHLAGAPDIKMLQPVPAGDPDKGQLRP